jgi:hypothetical protein
MDRSERHQFSTSEPGLPRPKVALVAAIAGTLAFAGISAGAAVHVLPPVQFEPAPLIQAVDEAPPYDMAKDWTPDPWVSTPPAGTNTCTSDTSGYSTCGGIDVVTSGLPETEAPSSGGNITPTPAQIAQLQQAERAALDAVHPAAAPRVIAKLDLGDDRQEILAAWHNSAGDVCVDSEETDSFGGNGSSGPSGPCELAAIGIFAAQCTGLCAQFLPPCNVALCLSSVDESGDGTHDYVLTGTVDNRADELDVTDATGMSRAYPLTGPVIPGSALRVFMLDLGASDWRRLDLLANRKVIDAQTMPLLQARSEECDSQVAPPDLGAWNANDPPDEAQTQAAMLTWLQNYNACLAGGGVDLGTGVFAAPATNAPGTVIAVSGGPTWTTGGDTTAGTPTSP